MKELEGIITPAVSPFRNGEIDREGIRKLVDHLHKINVSGIFPMGSTGVFPLVNNDTHKRIIEVYSEFRWPNDYFVPGVGRNSIEDTVNVAKYAGDIGADAIVVVTPYYIKMNQNSIFSYFDAVVNMVNSPILIYNIPQLAGNSITAETVRKLQEEYSNIIGIKDSSGDLSAFQEYLLELPKSFKVFQGQDELLLSSLIVGAAGGVCGTTNFIDIATKLYESFKKGDLSSAYSWQVSLSKLKIYLNKKSFPQIYTFLFHKFILGENRTGTLNMLSSFSKEEMEEIYSYVSEILEVHSRDY